MNLLRPFILAALVLLVLIFGLYVLLYRKQHLSSRDQDWIRKHWAELVDIQSSNPQQAILQADKLLDKALLKAGFQGNMGEKLKKAKHVFSDENGVWSAHKLRNRIAHEVGVTVSSQQVNTALQSFRKGLGDLGISL